MKFSFYFVLYASDKLIILKNVFAFQLKHFNRQKLSAILHAADLASANEMWMYDEFARTITHRILVL